MQQPSRGTERGYRSRWRQATKVGIVRRAGGRWGIIAVVVPTVGFGVAVPLVTGEVLGAVLGVVLGLVLGVGTWLALISIVSFLAAPGELDEAMRRERDVALVERDDLASRLDPKMEREAALAAFAERLDEGNALLSAVKRRHRRPRNLPREQRADWAQGFDERRSLTGPELARWKGDCRETVRRYRSHRLPYLDLELPAPPRASGIAGAEPQWLHRTEHELRVWRDRMHELQAEL